VEEIVLSFQISLKLLWKLKKKGILPKKGSRRETNNPLSERVKVFGLLPRLIQDF
tara:strand:- start:447 stop:611 length:165 start_codon:yes stop_codon:yes gene_type:complete